MLIFGFLTDFSKYVSFLCLNWEGDFAFLNSSYSKHFQFTLVILNFLQKDLSSMPGMLVTINTVKMSASLCSRNYKCHPSFHLQVRICWCLNAIFFFFALPYLISISTICMDQLRNGVILILEGNISLLKWQHFSELTVALIQDRAGLL